jgi:hypothetical protein
VAKKRKASRKTTSRRKRATPRGRSKNSGGVRMKGNKLDLRPLKKNIKAHITRLRKVKDPHPQITEALDSLTRVQRELTAACLPTMEIALA